MTYIAVVDDEPEIREILEIQLSTKFEVKAFPDGKSFIKSLEQKQPALVLLDIMMDNMNGYETQSFMQKKYPDISVVFLTAKSQTMDKVLGLDLGADDYITKPFQKEEVIARIHSILRLKGKLEDKQIKKDVVYTYEELVFNSSEISLVINDEKIEMTRTEYLLLKMLSSVPGRIFTREEILENVWKDVLVNERTIDVHIRRLRKKLGSYEHIIKSHPGFGYSIKKL